MLTRIVFLIMLPVTLIACSAIEDLRSPTGPEEKEITPLPPEEALQALEDLQIPYSQRAFIEHAAQGDLEVVRLFVWAGMDVNVQPYTARTVLVSRRENPTRLGHLETSWFPTDSEDNDTALMRAAGGGHLEVVKFLLANGADRHTENQQGQNAITFAAAYGHLEVVKFFVEQYEPCMEICEQEAPTPNNPTSVRNSCNNTCRPGLYGSPGMFWDALLHGPVTHIQWAAYNGHLDVVEYLYDPVIYFGGYGWPHLAFEAAALGGHLDVVDFFINHDHAGGKIRTGRGLMNASYMNHADIVKRLLEVGADLTYRTSEWIGLDTPEGRLYFQDIGFGPLHAAVQGDSPESLRLLLAHWMLTFGADGADEYGETALMFAAAGGDLEMAETLIFNGAPVNARSDIGETALMFAARWGRADMVSMLLAEGADASLVSAYNETALLLAEENGHEDVVALLQ